MIELRDNALHITFEEVCPQARLVVDFQRTLRIPDDGGDYPLPPGLGRFPLRHVDDFADRIPPVWFEHGGVMLPMYQSEAMWLSFTSAHVPGHGVPYPFAVKVATGKVDAVSGRAWTPGLHRGPQDYLVIPEQPWLDGYCVERGLIRQFVAMPLGAGYTAEEQVTGKAEYGGLQIAVYPMKREAFERRFPKRADHAELDRVSAPGAPMAAVQAEAEMGLAPGGRMRQEIMRDPFGSEDWDLTQSSRCFVHIANSLVWRAITGSPPPTTPPTAKEYTRAGLPWFEYFDESAAPVDGAEILRRMKSVAGLGGERGDVPLPENESAKPDRVLRLGRGRRRAKRGSKHEVREGWI